jgi:outer membrane biosynthesis protein TonB
MTGYRGGPKGLPSGSNSYASLSNKDVGGPIKTGKVGRVKRGRNEEASVRLRIRGSVSSQVGGHISAGSVSRLFRRKQSAIKTCYERTLKVNPKAQGKIKLLITIGPVGQVQMVRVVQNETGDSQLAACIVAKIKLWHFPRPKGGSVTITYPIMLQKM